MTRPSALARLWCWATAPLPPVPTCREGGEHDYEPITLGGYNAPSIDVLSCQTCGAVASGPSAVNDAGPTVQPPAPSCSDGDETSELVLPCGCVPPCEGHHEDES